jgi:hypothetical protein
MKSLTAQAMTGGIIDCLAVSCEETMLFKLWDRIEFGADVHEMSQYGKCPLETALYRKSILAIHALVTEGCVSLTDPLPQLPPRKRWYEEVLPDPPTLLTPLQFTTKNANYFQLVIRYLLTTSSVVLEEYKQMRANSSDNGQKDNHNNYNNNNHKNIISKWCFSTCDMLTHEQLMTKADKKWRITESILQHKPVARVRRDPLPIPEHMKKTPFVGTGKPTTMLCQEEIIN